jgi:hypothetical protein
MRTLVTADAVATGRNDADGVEALESPTPETGKQKRIQAVPVLP